jgi:hypothetical protein
MVSITLPPSQIVLRNSIKLFKHWLRCYYLLTIPNEIIFNYTHGENEGKMIGAILHPFD